ncbi:MAG: type II secretion system F family protein [Thermoguttaceae bacterium]|nr:type II secretion system F family protein [Thermoguttaceae bacterium]MDW8079933.1 type II secretion system F family protein [Thermoguttaceae bacterium]
MPPVKARDPLAALRAQSRQAKGKPAQVTPSTGRVASPPSSKPSPLPATSALRWRRINRGQIVYLTSQLAIMVQTGISLGQALEGIRRQEKHPVLREVLGELEAALERGEAFSAALSRFPRLFDKSYVAMVKAAEASGTLGPMLERLATSLRKSQETKARVRGALAYPVVMLALAIGVTVFLLTYVLPRFTPLFQSRGALLPTPTRVVLAVSQAITDWWFIWAGGIAALVAGYFVAGKYPEGRRWIDAAKLLMPIIGPVLTKFAICQSVRTLGTLLSGGVSMLEALRLTAEAAGNAHFSQFWSRVEEEVTTGKPLSELLGASSLIPPTVAQMVAAGEESGRLPEVLTKLADHMEADVDIAVKAATSLLEPVLIAVMGAIVGTIGLAVLLPIFSLSRPM